MTKLAFLPPMSGLANEEALIREGRTNVLLGQGQTAVASLGSPHILGQQQEKRENEWRDK